ncbi:hypothetical protein HRR83_008164 [Exophiala dermatitidis]|uniref:Uncharacterized protein n=1 Tax=Exophiala dermatitidis TaxID=5970 RepID=A0AAN6EQT1_EXODE|nr:hypothetical protein HRR74_007882 [Exophiala dermatitidis]KAJ4513594.1 hypothetical protein HRR73_005752 [Exophiala dermatitidis]KAJ4535563.1 hypothetical protein HRR77_007882 [Exophiala dermatitidis]KAJ4544487.1 hypothetical protein HRR76_002546 [Exophiala dermatitidis]KAJ4561449.1 hypothetical protein HRR79_007279 [Exophiala dermatitidis]
MAASNISPSVFLTGTGDSQALSLSSALHVTKPRDKQVDGLACTNVPDLSQTRAELKLWMTMLRLELGIYRSSGDVIEHQILRWASCCSEKAVLPWLKDT